MSATREQVLSEFIDSWNAGERPDVDDYIARVPVSEQQALGEELATFLTFAPTPDYSDAALAAIRAEVAEVVGVEEQPGLFAVLLTRLRERLGMSTTDVAGALINELGLREEQTRKTAGYLERLESERLEPARVSRRVLEALGKVFRVPGAQL